MVLIKLIKYSTFIILNIYIIIKLHFIIINLKKMRCIEKWEKNSIDVRQKNVGKWVDIPTSLIKVSISLLKCQKNQKFIVVTKILGFAFCLKNKNNK